MLLNNMKNWCINRLISVYPSSKAQLFDCKKLIALDGTEITNFYMPWTSAPLYIINENSSIVTTLTGNETKYSDREYTYLCVGSGNTPVSEEDYTLENIITTGISIASAKLTTLVDKVEFGNRIIKKNLSYIIQNTSDSSIVVGEVGLLQGVCCKYIGSSSGEFKRCLIHREVLEQPVTLESGASMTLAFDFDFTFKNTEQLAEEGEF